MNRNESDTRAIRALLGKSSERTNRLPPVAVVAVPAEIARIEVQEPRAVRSVRTRRRGPVVAERAKAVEGGDGAVAGSGEKDALRRIRPLARHEPTINAVALRPGGRAVVDERLELRLRRHPPRGAEMRRRRVVRGHEVACRINVARRLKSRIALV